MNVFGEIVKNLNNDVDISDFSSLSLSYIGDSVYETVVRSIVLSYGNNKVEKLHKIVSNISNAASQAQISDLIIDKLTDEEVDVFKRARNASKHSRAKHQSIADYKKSTGFEALIGWLYLKGDDKRILELVSSYVVSKIEEFNL